MHFLMVQEYTEEMIQFEQVEYEVLERMDGEEVKKLIDALPNGYRIVLNMALIDGYKHSEIAEMLGIGESTSRSQLAKARKLLQGLLEKKIINETRIAR